jgi:hypothetical protein
MYTGAVGSLATGTERLRIDSDGNVGIGDASPDAALSVTRGADAAIQIAAGSLADGEENVVTAITSVNVSTDFRRAQIGSYKNAAVTNTTGYLQLDSQDGANNYIWVDDSGKLRISTTKTHIGTTSGTVVGTQT